MEFEIVRVEAWSEALAGELARLLPQLSAAARADADRLRALVENPCTALFAARTAGHIVGMAALAWYDVPTGRKAWIEDVVVDETARGRGAGRALVAAAIGEASRIGAGRVWLTSRPARRAARALYRSMGFEAAETEVFVLKLDRQ